MICDIAPFLGDRRLADGLIQASRWGVGGRMDVLMACDGLRGRRALRAVGGGAPCSACSVLSVLNYTDPPH